MDDPPPAMRTQQKLDRNQALIKVRAQLRSFRACGSPAHNGALLFQLVVALQNSGRLAEASM